jgi:hypothetical protein
MFSAWTRTMPIQLFVKGLILGFAIAAPVGPIGVLCIRRSLADGQRAGLATGLGAATADAVYGCAAGFGLAAVSRFLVEQRFWLGLLGGLFLCYLGVRTFLTKPAENPSTGGHPRILSAYFFHFFPNDYQSDDHPVVRSGFCRFGPGDVIELFSGSIVSRRCVRGLSPVVDFSQYRSRPSAETGRSVADANDQPGIRFGNCRAWPLLVSRGVEGLIAGFRTQSR